MGSSILGGVKEVGGKVASSAKKTAGKAWGYVKSGVNYLFGSGKEKPKKHATGGYITKPTISWIGEAGKEFVILLRIIKVAAKCSFLKLLRN